MYITFEDFAKSVPNNIKTRDKWNALTDEQKLDLYQSSIDLIDNNWTYAGNYINYPAAFPRKYFDDINELEKDYNYSPVQKSFMRAYNKKIPPQVKVAMVLIGRDVLRKLAGQDYLDLNSAMGAKRIKDRAVEIEFHSIGASIEIEDSSWRPLRPFILTHFACKGL